jgi:hypothetical protein
MAFDGFLKMNSPLHPQFLSEVCNNSISWRWPAYQAWLAREDFTSSQQTKQTGQAAPAPLWWNALPPSLLNRYRSAAFIEWRYFSIISPDFHGICGFSLFNPEHHFPQFSEGGLIAIVAGALQGAVDRLVHESQHRAGEELERVPEFCFMHVFPMETVIFHGPERQHVRASHDGVELKIDMLDAQTADIEIEMEGGLSVRLRHQAMSGSPALRPVTATDFSTIPGAHWTIFNASPVAEVTGTLVVRPGLLECSEDGPNAHNPNFISRPLAEQLHNGYVKLKLDRAAGYYEHSFGLNPIPIHGWDFLFVPSPANKSGLVLQTYKGSEEASYLEVLWQTSDGSWKTLHIPVSECDVEWSESSWHPGLRVHVPRKRSIRAQKDGYTLTVSNRILGEIPFIRAQSPVVRHFFISEEFSSTSWSVTDAQGNECVRVTDVLSGGETARGRWYYNLSGLFNGSTSKPF